MENPWISWEVSAIFFNPSNAETTSVQTQGRKELCYVGIYWIALAEYYQMSTHMPGFQSLSAFLRHLVLAKLATSSIRVKGYFLTCTKTTSDLKEGGTSFYIWLL